jgi:hypothetical protein
MTNLSHLNDINYINHISDTEWAMHVPVGAGDTTKYANENAVEFASYANSVAPPSSADRQS